jgi:glutaredoxin/glutathione-dependent peroxiredoxin
MTIKSGERIPAGTFGVMTDAGPGSISTSELCDGKKVVLFAVPGAFTPTCSLKHLPGFAEQAKAIKAKGVDTVACMSVNDVFVMAAWGKATVPDGSVLMLADGNGEFTEALGLELDARGFGMGMRSQRFSMIIDNGVVSKLNVEPAGQFGVSSADTILEQLG